VTVWRDVRFDPGAAATAADALAALARVLDEETDVRARVADAARRDWVGRARDEADAILADEHRHTADLVAELRWMATRISLGAEEARLEQDRRERRREELVERGVDPMRVPT
jgi:hypothetical protein